MDIAYFFSRYGEECNEGGTCILRGVWASTQPAEIYVNGHKCEGYGGRGTEGVAREGGSGADKLTDKVLGHAIRRRSESVGILGSCIQEDNKVIRGMEGRMFITRRATYHDFVGVGGTTILLHVLVLHAKRCG
ncbi:hypothetical protein Sjap_010752 [Stephania japonica]|uniref:Uncharacterized protein n=1 Tax=Stephania japonica TaxID=461633 RepID=A0AAP0JB15_9MAGN